MRQPSLRFVLIALLAASAIAAEPGHPWTDPELLKPPTVTWRKEQAPDYQLTYENVPYQGRMASVSAYYSVPQDVSGKVPAMVLVHGGAGGAFQNWAKQWAGYGYAAIAMDLNGRDVPYGRPWGSDDFTAADKGRDSWYYHAVAAVMRAVSLVAARPEVDAKRIGMLGISWGGWTTCIVAGVDRRLALAVPVYGCGGIGECSLWSPITDHTYLSTFDPLNHLPHATTPMLFITGNNDRFYPLVSLRKSYRLPTGPVTVCVKTGMGHDYNTPFGTTEIRRYVDAALKQGPAIPQITSLAWEAGNVVATYRSAAAIAKAELVWTAQADLWKSRSWAKATWQVAPAQIDAAGQRLAAVVPAGATVYYLNLYDANGMQVSSHHVDLGSDPPQGRVETPGAAPTRP